MVSVFLTILASIFLAVPAIILGFIVLLLGAITLLIAAGIIGFVLYTLLSLLIAIFN